MSTSIFQIPGIDRDGRLDLAAYFGANRIIFVLKGGGDGKFGDPLLLSTPRAPQYHVVTGGIVATDLNQDGAFDLAAAQDKGIPDLYTTPRTVKGEWAVARAWLRAQPAEGRIP